MNEEGGKMNKDSPATAVVSGEPLPANYYNGTFQGFANYQTSPPSQSQPVFGFHQPIPPPGVSAVPPCYYPHGYQTVQGYAVAEGRPIREYRLPCYGMGIGWFLFIIGFFLGAIPWYIGAFLLLFVRLDYREKPGFIACTLAATLALVAMTLGVTKASYSWGETIHAANVVNFQHKGKKEYMKDGNLFICFCLESLFILAICIE